MKTESRITRNTFPGGRNSDVDPSIINPNQYTSAYNVELVSDGKFFALTSVNGTSEVRQITALPSDVQILGSFGNTYLIDSVSYKCLTIFTAVPGDKFKIWCYNIETDDLYELYQETIGLDYNSDGVDAINYPENGVDILYFTDNTNTGFRFLKCEIAFPYVANFLSAYQIALLRKGATGKVELDSIVATGGSLLSGTYQFSYRMADPVNKRFTKWSTLSNPIHVYSRDNGTDQVVAGIGLQTTRKISLSITPSEIELDNFAYYQLAVVENVGPTAPTTADLLDVDLTNAVGGVISFDYKSNASVGSIPLDDIIVDLAQIEAIKTLNVKQNRLFGGNVRYTELTFDGGIADPPTPPTIADIDDWVNATGANPGTWTLGATPTNSVNGNGGPSGYIAGAVATTGGSSYSFTVEFEIQVTGSSVPVSEVRIAILDSSFNELDSAIFNYSSAGIKSPTALLTPPTDGTYLAMRVTNNTPFDTKNYDLLSAAYNTPSVITDAPTITSGSIISKANTSPDMYASDAISSQYIGYFRDEVYRFGIVYTDENGNKSTVSPLNLNGLITNNQITAPLPDVKFPDRSTDPAYALINSSGGINALGLEFNGIKSHPSWAASLEIVRLPRKKNILFQTPIVPMYQLNGTGAINRYPTVANVPTGGESNIPDAQPQTAGFTYVPKNLLWPELRSTEKTTETVAGGTNGNLSYFKGEVKLVRKSTYDYAMIFPPQSMYADTDNPFVFVGNEKLNTVDYALLKCNATAFGTDPVTTPISVGGDYLDTSVIGSFFAVGDSQYFYDSATPAKSIDAQYKNITISDYEFFDNAGAPASVAGTTVLDYEAMQTKGVDWGYQPSVQRSAVVRIQAPITDLSHLSGGVTFKDGQLNQVAGGTPIFGATGPNYDSVVSNRYLTTYASVVTGGNNASNVSALPIANVTLGLGDDRYGDLDSSAEYISTGAKYTFTEAERALLRSGTDVLVDLEVWGGDCFVGYHSFKICDSTYSITNQNKYFGVPQNATQSAIRWNRSYTVDGSDHIFSIPVAVKNAAQFIQVLLESEYNGDVRDIDTVPMSSNFDVPRFKTTNETDARTPLTYKYNINLSKWNYQKVYFPKQQFSFVQNQFQARLVYSDIKIYNSDQAGFDIFRVSNFYDLEESRYGITKLAVGMDQLYAIQEQGIVYIPTGERQIEQTSGGSLSVRSGDVIGRPLIIDSKRGSQHIRGVVETGGVIYIPDNRNKSLYILSDQTISSITKDNESTFREVFENQIPGKNVIGIYDPVRRQYWFVDNLNNRHHLYNESLALWVGSHEFVDLKAGVFTKESQYLLGNNTVYQMYSNTLPVLFGNTVVPRVTFVINPDESLSKTFDDIMISASQRLDSLDIVVEREAELGNQVIPTIDLDSISIEGNYRVKTLFDSSDARARGLRAFATVSWKNVKSTLQAVWTRYRLSSRTPW